jgi:outer membrane protein assembly factor BamB
MLAVLPLSLLLAVGPTLSARAAAPGDWPQFHSDGTHSGFNRTETTLSRSTVPNLETKWTFAAITDPVVAGGTAYVVTGLSLVALDATTGSLLWTFTPTGRVRILSMPSVGDGRVYVVASLLNDPFEDCLANVYALDPASGTQLWEADSGCSNLALSQNFSGGTLFIPSNWDVNAFAADTGQLLWTFPTGATVDNVPAVARGVVYFTSEDGNLYAVEATTGTQLWTYVTGGGNSSAAVSQGRVYVGSSNGHVYCLNASTGALVWSFDTGWFVWSSPAVAYGTVFVGSQNGKLYALSALTGAKRWVFNTGMSNVGVAASPAVANGVVYVGSDNGSIYAVNSRSGAQLWTFSAYSFGSPAVSAGQVFAVALDYFGSNTAVYAFGLP